MESIWSSFGRLGSQSPYLGRHSPGFKHITLPEASGGRCSPAWAKSANVQGALFISQVGLLEYLQSLRV